jgi:hypothetical protein
MAHGPKPYAVILDHAGMLFEHGLPDEERVWSLKGEPKKRRRKGEPPPRSNLMTCVECYAIYRREPMCPRCGHIHVAEGAIPKEIEGELEEVNAENIEEKRRLMRRRIGMAKTREELEVVRKELGYKPGWTYWTMKARRSKQQPKNLED